MKELIKSISKKEWQFVAILTVVIIILTGLPYLVGYLNAPSQTAYNGLHALSPGDIPVYYSYINQVTSGEFLVKDLFTSEPQTLGTFNVWWTLVGLGVRFFHVPLILGFQLSRILMIPIFIFVAYLFISYIFPEVLKRKICLIFLFFASGIGFYFAGPVFKLGLADTSIYRWPIDLWIPEANTFNTLYQTSHFIASITLMLLIFLLMLLAFEKRKLSYALVSGVLALFYFNFHPYYVPVIFGVGGLYLFILMLEAKRFLWTEAMYLILVFLLSAPSIFYHFWLIQNSAVIAQRAAQNVTFISPPIFVFVGYGWLWLGLILGLVFLGRNKKFTNSFIFLLVWLLVDLALIYSPLPFHSRYTQGLHVVLVIFTVAGLFYLYDYLKTKLKPSYSNFLVENPFLLGVLFIVLLSPSTLFNLYRDLYFFTAQPKEVKEKFYFSQDVLSAMAWLKNQPLGQVVLASEMPAKFIPGFSGQPVYLAHLHETLFYDSKLPYLIWFLKDNTQDSAKKEFLNKQGIDYIFYSDYEKKLGSFDPATKNYLRLVFESGQVQIYQVIKD
ncbi:MAG: hypothetical protein WC675_04305 [Patescibacteria group bacterium]|jgi:hypothetical protein